MAEGKDDPKMLGYTDSLEYNAEMDNRLVAQNARDVRITGESNGREEKRTCRFIRRMPSSRSIGSRDIAFSLDWTRESSWIEVDSLTQCT